MVKEYRRPGYRAVTVGFSVNGSAAFLAFLKRAFDAREGDINWNPDGSIGHGEIHVGDSLLEISEAKPQWPAKPCSVHLYVTDADAWYARAVAAGAVSVTAPEDAPYGDRAATVRDVAGNQWFIATRLEGSPIPEGFHSITPYVITAGADAVMAFAKATFGATERARFPASDGTVMHAEMQIDDSVVEFSDGSPAWPATAMPAAFIRVRRRRGLSAGVDRWRDVSLRADGPTVRRPRMRRDRCRRQLLVHRHASGQLSSQAQSLHLLPLRHQKPQLERRQSFADSARLSDESWRRTALRHWPVPRHGDHVSAGDLVVPGLTVLVLENPQAAEPGDTEGEKARDASDEGVDETQRRAVEPDDAELTHDPAERRALPRPEADVVGEHHEDKRSRRVVQEIEQRRR